MKKGFTLIELMVVVVILGILAVVVAPRIPDLVKKANEGATKGALSTLRSTLNIYYSDVEGYYPATVWTYTANDDPKGGDGAIIVDALVPKYIKKMPVVKCPTAHIGSGDTVYVYEIVPTAAAQFAPNSDGLAWGYGSEYGSPSYGNVIVNCSHTDTGGTAWYTY